MTPASTIAAIKDGDESAFAEAFHHHYERVYLYVLKKTGSAYLAEETTQLSFVKLWQYRHSLQEQIPFLSQLFRIARTTMIDLIRKQQTASSTSIPLSDVPGLVSDDIFQKLSAHELETQLQLAIRNMPPVRKKVFELSRMEGKSNKEIAESLSISVKAVEFHITQALKYLRRYLAVIFFVADLGY